MVGGQFGLDFDSEEFFFGPNAILELPVQIGEKNVLLNPEFSYWLVDDGPGVSSSFWMLSVSGLYPLGLEFADTYAGAGLAITHWSFSFDTSDLFSKRQGIIIGDLEQSSTDIGILGKVGAAFGTGNIKPGAEVGFVASDSSWLYAQVFARLAI